MALDVPGFRLGIYIFKDAEIVDFAAPYGVFSVARRFDPELDAFFVADAMRPVQAQAGFTVRRLAVPRIPRSGTPEELLDHYGISARHIVDTVNQARA